MRDGRRADELRPVDVVPDFVEQADGSVLISFGKTRVLCTATIEEGVPRWLAGKGRGWLIPVSSRKARQKQSRRCRAGFCPHACGSERASCRWRYAGQHAGASAGN